MFLRRFQWANTSQGNFLIEEFTLIRQIFFNLFFEKRDIKNQVSFIFDRKLSKEIIDKFTTEDLKKIIEIKQVVNSPFIPPPEEDSKTESEETIILPFDEMITILCKEWGKTPTELASSMSKYQLDYWNYTIYKRNMRYVKAGENKEKNKYKQEKVVNKVNNDKKYKNIKDKFPMVKMPMKKGGGKR